MIAKRRVKRKPRRFARSGRECDTARRKNVARDCGAAKGVLFLGIRGTIVAMRIRVVGGVVSAFLVLRRNLFRVGKLAGDALGKAIVGDGKKGELIL